jgi:hypothetical protein
MPTNLHQCGTTNQSKDGRIHGSLGATICLDGLIRLFFGCMVIVLVVLVVDVLLGTSAWRPFGPLSFSKRFLIYFLIYFFSILLSNLLSLKNDMSLNA